MSDVRKRRCWASICLLVALVGCNDDGDVAAVPQPQAVARDDSATLAWNSAAVLALTSNDTIENGTASVSVPTAPSHGTAEVQGLSVRYTPAPGFFGADSFRYRLDVGGKTAEADVSLQVQAELTLQGVVRDAPLAGASVVLTVGTDTLPAVTTDAQGAYSVSLRTADPTALIGLKATAAAPSQNIVLQNWLGDAAFVATAASAGVLSAANVTHVTTAVAALSEQALGRAPANGAELRAVQAALSTSQTVETAAAIKLVADAGVALPDSVADTLALALDTSARAGLVSRLAVENPDLLADVRQAVLADADIAVPLPAPAAGEASRSMLFVLGEGAGGLEGFRLVLNADGSGRLEGSAVSAGAWQRRDGGIVFRYDEPFVSGPFPALDDPYPGFDRTVFRELGVEVRQLAGAPGAGPAVMRTIGEQETLEGPNVGTVENVDSVWRAQRLVDSTLPLTAEDFAPGSRWAGLMAEDYSQDESMTLMQDTLSIVDATTAQMLRLQRAATYRLVDGRLELSVGDAVYTYARLFTGPRGEERWLAEKRVGDVLQWVAEVGVVKVQAGASLTMASAQGARFGYVNAGFSFVLGYVELRADGSGQTYTLDEDGVTRTTTVGTWSILPSGEMEYLGFPPGCPGTVPGCELWQRRVWQPVASSGIRLYVMETLWQANGFLQERLNVYTGEP